MEENYNSQIIDILENSSINRNRKLTNSNGIENNIIKITDGKKRGTGVLIGSSGLFLTNYHVLSEFKRGDYIHINYNGLEVYTTLKKTLKQDKGKDLALGSMSISKKFKENLEKTLGIIELDLFEPCEFDKYFSYGYKNNNIECQQGGYELNTQNSIRHSSALTEEIVFLLKSQGWNYTSMFHTNCEIERGWSGGPIINSKNGKLVGMNQSIFENKGRDKKGYLSVSAPAIFKFLKDYVGENNIRE